MTEAEPQGRLLGPAEIRDLAELLGVTPTKKLGQNFVHDANTVRRIARLAGVTADDRVLEVGPGLGSLTLGLTETGARVVAVEIDRRLAEQLPRTVRELQPGASLDVIASDALRLTAEDVGGSEPPNVLVANLPYNVSVPILMHLLELLPSLARGLVMVQAEVGYRIAAGPGSKEYGAPSAKAAWYGDWRVAGVVSRRIFWPVPGVDSVLVSFERRTAERGSEEERTATFELVNAAFAQRRKMLRQSLQPVIPDSTTDTVSALLAAAGVDASLRAEQIDIEGYLAIVRELAG